MTDDAAPRALTESEREVHERIVASLVPFVIPWNLQLNPEDLDEIAYAIVVFALSDGDRTLISAQSAEFVGLADRINAKRLAAQEARLEEWRRNHVSHINSGDDRTVCGLPLFVSWHLQGHAQAHESICSACIEALGPTTHD